MTEVLLIAGVARSGKTTLAHLASQTGYDRVPGDALVSALHQLYPDSGIAHEGDDTLTSAAFFPFLSALVERLVRDDGKFVVDTAKLLPRDAATLCRQHEVKIVFLGFPRMTPADKLAAIRTYPNSDDWTATVPDALLLDMIGGMIAYSRKLAADCAACGVPFIDTGQNYQQTLAALLATLCGERSRLSP